MITISVNSDYGIQTGDFDVTFTATRTNGDVMDYIAVVGDDEFEGTATSGTETSFTVSNFEDLASVNNKITLTVSYNNDVSTAEIAFMKFVPPVIIPKKGDYAGEISNAGYFYINVKDVLSPINSSWHNITGVLVWGFYLDQVDDQHRLPIYYGEQLGKKQVKNGEVIISFAYPDKSQISIGQHTVFCVVGMMKSGDVSILNKDDPWKYDNYALVQKAVTADNFSQNFNWITPKTNWIYGEGLGHTDYNRIKNNLLYLHDIVNMTFTPFEFSDLGNDKVVSDYYYADEFNALEDELEAINEHSVEFDIGTKQTFYQLGKFIGYIERNRIENATLELKNFVWNAISIPYLIAPLVYTGQTLYPVFYDNGGYNKSGDLSGLAVGTYSTTFTLDQDCYWTDGTTDPITLSWTIDPCPVYVPTVSGSYVYNGNTQNVTFDTYNTQAITLTGELSGRSVGTYTVTASLNANYVWEDGTTEDKTIEWNITRRLFAIPYIKPYEYIYSGNSYHIANSDIENYVSSAMQRSDSGSEYQTNAGTYTFDVSLIDTTNNAWVDGTTTPITLSWTIQKASGHVTLDKNNVTLNFSDNQVYIYATDFTGTVSAISRNSNIIQVIRVTSGSSTIAIVLGVGTTSGNTIVDVNVAESSNYNATTVQINATFIASVDKLTAPRSRATGVSAVYALVAGGYYNSNYSDVVDIYGSSLWHSTYPALSVARRDAAGASRNDYNEVIIAGGYNGSWVSTAEFYDLDNGTRTVITPLSTAKNTVVGIGNRYYSMFAGDTTGVDVYDSSNVKSTAPSLDGSCHRSMAVANAGVYTIFAGGSDGTNYSNKVEAYNRSSLTKTLCPNLTNKKAELSGGGIGSNAIFVGGQLNDVWGSYDGSLDCYDSSLTKQSPSHHLGVMVANPATVKAGDYLFIAGGDMTTSNKPYSNKAFAYDDSLTRHLASDLSYGKGGMAAVNTRVYQEDGYALFAGGQGVVNNVLTTFDDVELYNQSFEHVL